MRDLVKMVLHRLRVGVRHDDLSRPGFPEAILFESSRLGLTGDLGMVARLDLGGRDVSDRPEETAVVEPVDPFEGGEFDRFEAAPGATSMDRLGFVEAIDGFGE